MACLRRDFALARSYRLSFVLSLLSSAFSVTLLFGIGRLVGDARADRLAGPGGYLAFAVLGVALLGLAQAALQSQGARLRNEQTTGTLEALLAGPARPWELTLAGSSYDVVQASISALFTVVLAMVVFGVRFPAGPVAAAVALVAFVASLGFVLALGMGLAAVVLVFKQATTLVNLGVAALTVLCGAYFPLRVLPAALATVGQAIPLTWGLDVLRSALLAGRERLELLGALLGVDLVAFLVAALAVEAAVARSRRIGALGQY